MGSKGDSYDNAVAESFLATLKKLPICRAKRGAPGRSQTRDLRIRSGRFAGLFSSMR
jgi:hypothetical protein